jgi:hypothetical protein
MSIKYLVPFTAISLLISIYANYVNQSFVSNVFIGLFGSGALTVIASIIGYRVERRFALEQFYFDVKRILKVIMQYDYSMGLNEKIDYFINFHSFEQSDIDVSVGRLYFFFDNKETFSYIYESIYNPVCELRNWINLHYWNFRCHKDGSVRNETVMIKYIDEIENVLLGINKHDYGTSITPKLSQSIYNELSNKFYILMYGKKAYKKQTESASQ